MLSTACASVCLCLSLSVFVSVPPRHLRLRHAQNDDQKPGEKNTKKRPRPPGERKQKKTRGAKTPAPQRGWPEKRPGTRPPRMIKKSGEKTAEKNAKSTKGKKSKKKSQGSQNTCVSKGLARKAARRPTAQDDQKKRRKKMRNGLKVFSAFFVLSLRQLFALRANQRRTSTLKTASLGVCVCVRVRVCPLANTNKKPKTF